MNTQNTALLFFSRTAKSEAKIKPLALGRSASEKVAAFAIETVCSMAKQTDIPLFVITEKDQRGSTFGERFAHAFEDIFQQGYEKVIAIGNDCLTISVKDIIQAAEIVAQNKCVIGPSMDGGTYLIGMHKDMFQKQIFKDLCWQSEYTLISLQNYFENTGNTIQLLSLKEDIDSISNWSAVLKTLTRGIKKAILQLFEIGKTTLVYFVDLCTSEYHTTNKSLRAPPFSI